MQPYLGMGIHTKNLPMLVHPLNHFIHCTIGGELKLIDCCGFKYGLIGMVTSEPCCHFIEDYTENVSEIFWSYSSGNTMIKIAE